MNFPPRITRSASQTPTLSIHADQPNGFNLAGDLDLDRVAVDDADDLAGFCAGGTDGEQEDEAS